MTFKNFLALEKKTSSGIYLDNLTGIRAFAVLWVLIFHTWGLVGSKINLTVPFLDYEVGLTRIVRMGEWGVDIFFVLSGFLLAIPFLKDKFQQPSWSKAKEFYSRRALRILPAYYLTLLCLIYILPFGLGKSPAAFEMLQHATFTNTWLGTPPLRGAFWSLPVEALFYVFLPLLIWVAWRLKSLHTVFISLIILTIILRIIIVNSPQIESKGTYLFSFFGRMDQFSIGVLCANLCIHKSASSQKGNLYLILGFLGMLIFASFIGRRGDMFGTRDYFYYFFQTIVGLLAACIIYGAASASILAKKIFGNKAMILIGTISYSIYLWHTIILDIFITTNPTSSLPSDGKMAIIAFYTWPPIFLISLFSYLFAERYFLKIRHDSGNQENSLINRNPIKFLIFSAAVLSATAGAVHQIKY